MEMYVHNHKLRTIMNPCLGNTSIDVERGREMENTKKVSYHLINSVQLLSFIQRVCIYFLM